MHRLVAAALIAGCGTPPAPPAPPAPDRMSPPDAVAPTDASSTPTADAAGTPSADAAAAHPTPADPAPADPAPPARVDVPWAPPTGALSPPEQALVGTWVAQVAPPHIQPRSLLASTMLQVDAAGKDPVRAILDAADDPRPIPSTCYWMELRQDRTGFWSACALVGGEPVALERVDPATGTKGPFGQRLRWTHDSDARLTRIRFDDDLAAPIPGAGYVDFRHLELRFVAQRGEGIDVEQRLPEYAHTDGKPTVWNVYPGQFLGQ